MTEMSKDPEISGYVYDRYIGNWWGAVKSPPEMHWSDYQFDNSKPVVIGEWGGGCGMDVRSAWNKEFYAMRQSWGRNFAGLKVCGMAAWDAGNAVWCNLFDLKTDRPLPVTAELMDIKNELIPNPLKKKPEVVLVSNRSSIPLLYTYIPLTRVAACLPQVGLDFSIAEFKDLKNWDMSHYKLMICYAEGMRAEDIENIRKFKGTVFIVGRPSASPEKSAVPEWIAKGFFIKTPVTWKGSGGAAESAISFKQDFGSFKAGQTINHYFSRTKCAWVKPAALMDDVEVIAEADGCGVLMRQGNVLWYTDTLASSEPGTCEYPTMRREDTLMVESAALVAGLQPDNLPVKVWTVNDVAFSYDVNSGRVQVHNPGTVQLPEGITLRSYDRFNDAIVMELGGKTVSNDKTITVRCSSKLVKSVVCGTDRKPWKDVDARHISFDVDSGTNGRNVIMEFKK
jgi:hypothetical protein